MLPVIFGKALFAKKLGLGKIAVKDDCMLSAFFTIVRPAHIRSVLDAKSRERRCPQFESWRARNTKREL